MKVKLLALSAISFFLLMYLAAKELYFPYIIFPFIGVAVSVFLWPEKKGKKKRKRKSGDYDYENDALDLVGESLSVYSRHKRQRVNQSDNDVFDNDIDLDP